MGTEVGRVLERFQRKKEQDRIVSLVRSRYPDFGPTLVAEKLLESHEIDRNPTTVREILVKEGLWIPRAKRPGARPVVHRAWRERRAHPGELVQFDGSYHHWFEDRGGTDESCLLAAIDDATGDIRHLQFVQDEGTLPVMAFWTQYAYIHGLPQSVYLDRFSTYKMTQKVAQENHDLKTQLQRATDTLGLKLIFALSPQAKGRVERLFRTLQTRLVKELRLRNISTVEEANNFVGKTFLHTYNKKFGVEPREPADFHRKLSERELRDLPETFCRMERRSVMNDFTFSFQAQWHQILPTKRLAIRPKDDVLIREYPDSKLSFSVRNKRVETKPIPKRQPVKVSVHIPTKTLVPT
jgi:hypothetical protein